MAPAVHSWITSEIASKNLDAVANWIAKRWNDHRILDAGCGTGKLLGLLHAHGIPQEYLFGCDIEPGHVQVAKQTNPGTYILWDVENGPPFPHLKFGFVAAIAWLHNDWKTEHRVQCTPRPHLHPWQPKTALHSLAQALTTDGRIICDWRRTNTAQLLQDTIQQLNLIKEHSFFAGYDAPTLILKQGTQPCQHVSSHSDDSPAPNQEQTKPAPPPQKQEKNGDSS